ncbi:hypothetical protein [Sphingobium xenophagum]|uniref:hypothetical protein n=1 Tax=Sphingobium xenophagum TaxID=121428 RepID=UPI00031039EB|nr:hypothetical protein [Sphingobium xenophagum]
MTRLDDAAKARFRQFAESWNDDDVVDDSGVTGADLKAIADMVDDVVMIPEIDLRKLRPGKPPLD